MHDKPLDGVVVMPYDSGMEKDELKAARKGLGLTQTQLAKALGVSRGTIASWEVGRYTIPPYLALAMKGIEKEQSK
jgi:DNA-binding XRE family transcriptional regulator